MAKILNIETATDICSICVADGSTILATKRTNEVYRHASVITLLIEACLKDAGLDLSDLDAVAVSSGPGSYTALRIGTATAKGICYALQKPMIAVDTLKALAYAAQKENRKGECFISMIDARRMEVYAKAFDAQLTTLMKVDNIILDETSFKTFFEQYTHVVFCGNGAPKSASLFEPKGAVIAPVYCDANYLVPLSFEAFKKQSFVDIAYYSPYYFKAPNITKSKKTL